MIIAISYTPNEKRGADLIFHFVRGLCPDSTFWFIEATAEQHGAALLSIRQAMEAPTETPELLLNAAKGIVGPS